MRPFAELTSAIRSECAKAEAGGRRRARVYWHPLFAVRAIDFAGLEQQMVLLGASVPERASRPWTRRALHSHRLRDAIVACGRAAKCAVGLVPDVAIVPTGWPTSWFRGRTLVQITSDGFLVREIRLGRALAQGASVLARGLVLAARLGLRRRSINPLPPAPTRVRHVAPAAGAV